MSTPTAHSERRWAVLPDSGLDRHGNERRVGIELEFGGLGPDVAARILAETLGGKVRTVSEFEYEVETPTLGSFRVEVDLRLLTRLGRELEEQGDEASELKRWSADLLGTVASAVTPVEVVTPPIPASRLAALDELVIALRHAGALGTSHSALYAFGAQLNPAVPDERPAALVAYLQAYLCLHDWLVARGQIDPVRRLSPFVNRFPSAYEALVLDEAYAPGPEQFLDDYLEHNPTRNRSLDLLPLLAWLDEDRVRARLPEEKINRRPTFHYRLPNCEIHDPEWSLETPWRRWLQVEYLAHDAKRLASCRHQRRLDRERLTSGFDDQWVERCEAWLTDL